MKKIALISFIINFIIADYASDIQPIFDSNCTSCHSGSDAEADLSLTSYNNLMNGGESGDVVIPYDSANSLLWQYINSSYMPPYGSGSGPLTTDQINLIEQWINAGSSEGEVSDIVGCMDSNAISCDDEINTLYFPECNTCSEGISCDNYYNPNATVDNELCMYSDVPTDEQFSITTIDSGINVDWSAFTPPVDVVQYVLQRCVDLDGDTLVFSCEGENSCQNEFWEESCESIEGCSWNGELDGELEYETCQQVIPQGTFYLETSVIDNYVLDNESFLKYTFYVHYPNNNYWGSAWGIYYYESECTIGDLNDDTLINVQDIISLVNAILNPDSISDICAADLNADNQLNVQDIVSLVNLILSI